MIMVAIARIPHRLVAASSQASGHPLDTATGTYTQSSTAQPTSATTNQAGALAPKRPVIGTRLLVPDWLCREMQ